MSKFFFNYLMISIVFVHSTLALDRRRDQFTTDFGYLVAPIPYILPGAGAGLGFLGGFNNIPLGSKKTTIDLFIVGISGNVSGTIAGITDLPLWPETLLLDLTTVRFNKGSQKVYRDRKMDSDPENFYITELADTNLGGGRLILTLFDRMFELFTIQFNINASTSAIRDNEGNLVYQFDPPKKFKVNSRTNGAQIDWTDDRVDPRKGIRIVSTIADRPAADSDSADYYVQDYNVTTYIPLLSNSTFALNWFRSGAFVREKGNIDETLLYNKLLKENCTYTSCTDSEKTALQDQAKVSKTNNEYGTAGSLGGASRLRSYAGGRFSGAQVEFRAAEFRWNLTDENKPFDLYFIRDVRTGIQLAFFYEEGSVANKADQLWKEKRTSQGAGVRLVTSSGFVYRFDMASGQEGREVILFVDYPWGTIGQ
ncbi:MAG: hypothetical protein QGH49_18110 [SAR324 cluster bacterium]|jgi:hypothetical protein|nr:hypothetical protein [SAR324 cluster bacterium]